MDCNRERVTAKEGHKTMSAGNGFVIEFVTKISDSNWTTMYYTEEADGYCAS